ncbi:MAG: hypothetical protein HFG54_02080 [Lachnospiraceae bacterium]|nr:hypothetical protein [Lachnospiraceae bacterium]
MKNSDFSFSLSDNSVNEINTLLEQYAESIVELINGLQDELIEHISSANYDKLLRAVDGIIELYNDAVRSELKHNVFEKWRDTCESMTYFSESMEMGEEAETVAASIEESLSNVFDAQIDNRLSEVVIDGKTSASIYDFDQVKEIFSKVVAKAHELSDDFTSQIEKLSEENEFYRFLLPVITAYNVGIATYFDQSRKNLDDLEDSYLDKMESKRDAAIESKKEVDLSSLLDFSDLAYAGMGAASAKSEGKRKEKNVTKEPVTNSDLENTNKKYGKVIEALRKFDGKDCTFPELKRRYDEHLANYKNDLDAKVKAEYDKWDRELKQYYRQLEEQLKSRHKELDGRYIRGMITLQQAQYLYAESCAKAEQLYLARKAFLWEQYQLILKRAQQLYSSETERCNQIANRALRSQQSICRQMYGKRDLLIKRLSSNDDGCVNEIRSTLNEIGKNCSNKCRQVKELAVAVDSFLDENQFDRLIIKIPKKYSPLNKELERYKKRDDKLTWDENLKSVNPLFSVEFKNGSENYVKYHHNCQRCVMAYEARQRGFDVVARPRKTVYDNIENTWKHDTELIAQCKENENGEWVGFPSIYKNPVVERNSYDDSDHVIQDIERKMVSYGVNSRMIVGVHWENGGGHVFVVENVGGRIVFCDPQNGNSGENVENYFKSAKLERIYLMRTDNLEFTDLAHECFE